MLERAAKAAYEEMVNSARAQYGSTFFPGGICAWEAQTDQLREDWRAAVSAALRVYGVELNAALQTLRDAENMASETGGFRCPSPS